MPDAPNTNKSLLCSAAALEGWANTVDRTARTANARKAFIDQFETLAAAQAARNGVVYSPEELARRAAQLRKAWFKRLAAKSVAARKARSLKSRVPPKPTELSEFLNSDEARLDEPGNGHHEGQ